MAARPAIRPPTDDALKEAACLLSHGALVAVPTETVYGLAARAADPEAVAKLFAAKGRPAKNPLIVHTADAATAFALIEETPAAQALADLWPGPLTLVGTRRAGANIALAASAGGRTLAVRVPAGGVMRALCAAVGPLVAPSANRSGRVSATTADAVAQEFSAGVALILDGGPSEIGVESTVVSITGAPALLRPGAIDGETLTARAGPLAPAPTGGPLLSPGRLASHYAPEAAVRLDVRPEGVRPGEAYIAFGPADGARATQIAQLSATQDLGEAAHNLYAALRTCDTPGVAAIAVAPIPARGLGHALRDRLQRAAEPRDEADAP
ncbi:MAG: L-threonylcarbamoyladenylate synthase [Pseudomonadota bacterium]